MRIWSLHPKYLDVKGLVALWRETLLAKNVLLGNTRGYKNHPQLLRFKACGEPLHAINAYLDGVLKEAEGRGYAFKSSKIDPFIPLTLPVTRGQLQFEKQHLLLKLQQRAPEAAPLLSRLNTPETHPIFAVINGAVEPWEKIP